MIASIHSPLFYLLITLIAYQVGMWAYHHSGQFPLFNPVLIAIVLIILTLIGTHSDYTDYEKGVVPIQLLNGLVVVALACPLYRYRQAIADKAMLFLLIIALSGFMAFLSGVLFAKLFHFSPLLTKSVAARSVTTPLAILITQVVHGNTAVVTLLAILNGTLSSMLTLPLLNRLKIQNNITRGLTLGVSATAIGTALAFKENDECGSFAALGMIVNGILSAIFIPLGLLWL